MSRDSVNQVIGGRLVNGYDYHNQAWVLHGRYVACGHPKDINCNCFGKVNAGLQTAPKGKEYFEGRTV